LKGVWKEYKKSRQNAKMVISSAKEKKQKECVSDLNDPEHQNEIVRTAKQMVKEQQDMKGSNWEEYWVKWLYTVFQEKEATFIFWIAPSDIGRF